MSADKFSNPVVRWIDHRLPIFSFMDHELNEYPTPKNLNYFWNFGSGWRIISNNDSYWNCFGNELHTPCRLRFSVC
ncbi:MAG: hypothetical protein CM15mP117_18370 [Alphaproteobacteria bacterium]|nr:MAG: hypothetical protein CM15mP117_18370 [Alphaproteobacteria bacterium]